MNMSLMSEDVKNMIGKEITYFANEEIGFASIRYFELAISGHKQINSKKTLANQSRAKNITALPTFIFETNQYMNKMMDEDGYIGHTWDIPLDVEYSIVRGGNEYKIYQPLLPSTKLEVKWTIENITEKKGSNSAFLIVSSNIQYFNQDKILLAENIEDMIYIPKN
tara:strand:- start:9837 stop:10334 length:498 start_codon:yes stop_codon:yes gene_type:complete